MRLNRNTRGLGAVLFGSPRLLVALACDGDSWKGASKSEATPRACRDYVTPDEVVPKYSKRCNFPVIG